MDDAYCGARKEKLKQLRRLLQELAAEGDEEMSGKELGDVMEEAGEASEESLVADAEEALGTEEAAAEELDPFEKEKRDYFKPKAKERRPGTAVMIAALEKGPSKGPLMPKKGLKGKTA